MVVRVPVKGDPLLDKERDVSVLVVSKLSPSFAHNLISFPTSSHPQVVRKTEEQALLSR